MKEEELLKKRLLELAQKSYSQNVYTHTHFLNEYEQSIYQDMKKELNQNGLTGKTDHILTLQPVPEKMHQVSLRPIITHLLNLPETIR